MVEGGSVGSWGISVGGKGEWACGNNMGCPKKGASYLWGVKLASLA